METKILDEKELKKMNEPKQEKKLIKPFSIKLPLLGGFAGLFTSLAVGNGVGWNILHFFLGWYYVVYKLAYLIFSPVN
jgi:hypothetical protein